MARTKADSCSRKAVAAKAPRKVVASPTSASTSKVKAKSGKTVKHCGGNRYCPRPTPPWQKDINTFFPPAPKDAAESSSSNSGNESFGSDQSDDMNEPGPSGIHHNS